MAKTNKPKTEGQPVEEALQETPAPQEKPSQATPSLQEDTVTVDSPTGLNLRDGPGLQFNVLEELPDGASLTVLQLPEGAEVPGYALVRYTGGEGGQDWPLVGWVNTDFVRED